MSKEIICFIACGVLLVLWVVFAILLIMRWQTSKKQNEKIDELKVKLKDAEEANALLTIQLNDKQQAVNKQAEIIADLMTKNADLKRSNLLLSDQIREECEAEKVKIVEEYEAKLEEARISYETLEQEYSDYEKSCKLGEYMISQAESYRLELESKVKRLTSENCRLKGELEEYQKQG